MFMNRRRLQTSVYPPFSIDLGLSAPFLLEVCVIIGSGEKLNGDE